MDDIDEFMASVFAEMDNEEVAIFSQSLIEADKLDWKDRKELEDNGK